MKKSASWILFFLCFTHLGYSKDPGKGLRPLVQEDSTASIEQLYSESYLLNSFASKLYINKGIYRMREGKYELAIENFQHALRLNPASFEAYSLLGEAMVALELKTEALNAFDKAIDLNPFYANAYFHRANLLQRIGQYKDAYRDYSVAMYIDPIYIHAFREYDTDVLFFRKVLRTELKALKK